MELEYKYDEISFGKWLMKEIDYFEHNKDLAINVNAYHRYDGMVKAYKTVFKRLFDVKIEDNGKMD